MTKGPRRLVLDQYLDSAAPGVVRNAGRDWKEKADDLQELGEALKQAAAQAELRIGEQTLTGPALRAGMEAASVSMLAKSDQLRAAGEALRQVGQHISDTRDTRDALTDLGEKPSPYQAPAGTPGVELTTEEIQAQADASQARSDARGAWQTHYDQQESKALALTREMDAAFLGAIPPMKDIHGQQDPTEPPSDVPSGPGGTYLPGIQAPPPTGGGNGGRDRVRAGLVEGRLLDDDDDEREQEERDREKEKDRDRDRDEQQRPPRPTPVITAPPTPVETVPTHVGPEGPTSTVTGSSQDGVSYQPGASQTPAPSGVGGSAGASSGASAAALGAAGGAGGLAAGGAGGMAAGSVRPGQVTSAAAGSSAPVRAIGSTGRAGSAGALSRSAGAAGSPAPRSAAPAAGRGAGAAGGAGSLSAGSPAGRSSAGGAGGRGAGAASGSRSAARAASGARSAGAGTGAGRGARKGEREQATDRDSLVYDQDWLGDDDVAPGVLD